MCWFISGRRGPARRAPGHFVVYLSGRLFASLSRGPAPCGSGAPLPVPVGATGRGRHPLRHACGTAEGRPARIGGSVRSGVARSPRLLIESGSRARFRCYLETASPPRAPPTHQGQPSRPGRSHPDELNPIGPGKRNEQGTGRRGHPAPLPRRTVRSAVERSPLERSFHNGIRAGVNPRELQGPPSFLRPALPNAARTAADRRGASRAIKRGGRYANAALFFNEHRTERWAARQ